MRSTTENTILFFWRGYQACWSLLRQFLRDLFTFSLTLRTYEDHSRSFERLVQVVNKTRLRQLKFIKLHFIRVTKAWFKSFVPLHHSSTAVGAQTDVVVLMLYRTKSFGYVFSLDLNSVATFLFNYHWPHTTSTRIICVASFRSKGGTVA